MSFLSPPPPPERVAVKCSMCGVDCIVSTYGIQGLKVAAAKVLRALAAGRAGFACWRCSHGGRV